MNSVREEKLYEIAMKYKKKDVVLKSTENEDRKLAEWQLFFLNNLDIFTEYYLDIPLKHFQRQLLLNCVYYDVNDIITSRGLSKSFCISILANDLALLLPGISILITSKNVGQSNIIIQEKIDEILTSETSTKVKSRVLQQMRKDGYITFTKEKTTDALVVRYGNGSKIYAVNCGESARGKRANIVIVDEAALISYDDYLSIIKPTLEPYNVNGLFLEQKEIFLTSARTKDNWMWKHLVRTVNMHYKNTSKFKYGFFAGDIYTAVANGIKTVAALEDIKSTTNDFAFQTEHLNIWLGEGKDAIFKYSDFHNAQTLENPFILTSVINYGYEGFQNIEKNEDEIRILSCDIAIVGGRNNDNTVFILGRYNIKTGMRSFDYIKAYNGLKSSLQVAYLKRLYYDYQCDYIIFDTGGAGNPIFDYLTEETEDKELNRTIKNDNPYPSFILCNDKKLQVSSDSVIQERREKIIDTNGLEVLIPYNGTAEINSSAHYAVWNALREKKIELLKNKREVELDIEDKDPLFIMKDPYEKKELFMSYLETDLMIDEIISLDVKKNDLNKLSVKEKRSGTKDRYMTFAMFNLLCDKIASKYSQNEQDDEFDLDDWSFLAGVYN